MRMTRPVAWTVTLALSVVVSANCITSKDRTPEQKACCADMGHDCGAAALERNCCPGEGGKVQGVAAATVSKKSTPPVAVLIAVLQAPLVTAPVTHGLNSPNGLTVKPPGTPTYLLVSTFRI